MKKFCAAAFLALAAFSSPAFSQTQESADAKYAAQDWQGASNEYQVLLDADADNAQNWYNLARALHQLEKYAEAEKAYKKAIDAGFANPAFAQYHMARLYMATGKKSKALAMLEKVAETGGVPGGYIQGTAEFSSLAEDKRFIAVVAALTPCTAPEYRHFDFWLGEWDVTAAGNTQPTASSKISSQQAGCVILEEYTAGGFTGMSINFYDNVTKRWHQSWMSNAGSAVYLEGGLNDKGEMAMSDEGMTSHEVTGNIGRTTWTPNADGSVRQLWEQSTDGGETWATVFDGIYTKKTGEE
jgi:tetratricopeptide (TPR) repeat protein